MRSIRRARNSCLIASFSLVAALLLGSLSVIAEEVDSSAPPKLKIVNEVYNFGSVSEGTKVKYDFQIKNEGPGNLQIQRMVPACGCTASSASQDVIAPGTQGSISVEFDTTGFAGEKVKTVRVYTNDPDLPVSMLSLKGEVVPSVVIEPKNVFLPDVTQGSEEAQQKVTVEVRKGAKDKISAISTYSKKIQIKEIEKSDRKAVFVVSVSPETPVGELRDRVVISLTGGSRTSINLPVFASVLGPLRFVPSSLSFGLIEGTEMIKRSVKLENRGKEPVEIKKVTTSNPAVQAEFKPIKAGKLYVIDIMVDPAQVKDDLRATVEVITDTGQEKPLSLSVYGILPPAV